MNDDKLKATARQKFHEYLSSTGKRRTTERDAILDCVMTTSGHFSIEDLRDSSAQCGVRVSLATVYNTLELLVDCGLVMQHRFDNKMSRYEKMQGTSSHHHLVCTVCGKIKEVRDNEMLATIESKRYRTFYPSYFSLTIFGICSTCHRKAARDKHRQ
jgi:Fur family ferric uptake transcriptional regulator